MSKSVALYELPPNIQAAIKEASHQYASIMYPWPLDVWIGVIERANTMTPEIRASLMAFLLSSGNSE